MKHCIVVTTINAPTISLERVAKGAAKNSWSLIVAGDTKTPAEPYAVRDDIDFIGYDDQSESGYALAKVVRERSYTRKMFGYLKAIESGASYIVETDDDNWPKPDFFVDRDKMFGVVPGLEEFCSIPTYKGTGWLNIYRYFAPASNIWPRGFPLSLIGKPFPVESEGLKSNNALILQGLADGAPDVDAVHRFVYPGVEFLFDRCRPLQLEVGSWCPFNSQNTSWRKEAFFLLYLPATCSFRMTDIYRGYIAQRIVQEMGKSIVFHDATVHQDRNEHSIIRDFKDEVMNYCDDGDLISGLEKLDLSGLSKANMLRRCYELAISEGYCDPDENIILEAWIEDCSKLGVL
ncbi:STELLO glycosyltransferase family protein [Nioella nitratireducens]|uniref:STELLO glycosyltransferase family protein n=1 Tax=Nioella nitratireducens TaxID=1287720 RepID=UPI0008FD88D1|nr:STELLO glycosyltransferase family protein [Nioella nitratireducens]